MLYGGGCTESPSHSNASSSKSPGGKSIIRKTYMIGIQEQHGSRVNQIMVLVNILVNPTVVQMLSFLMAAKSYSSWKNNSRVKNLKFMVIINQYII